MRLAVPGRARDDEWGWPTISLDITNHIGYMPQHLTGARERNRFARRYPKGRRLSGRPLIRMRGITQRKAGHGSNPTRRRLAPQGSQLPSLSRQANPSAGRPVRVFPSPAQARIRQRG